MQFSILMNFQARNLIFYENVVFKVFNCSYLEYRNRSLNPYFGGIIGRVSNRISDAKFNLNGASYQLEKNDGENCLHGGYHGLNWVSLKFLLQISLIKDGFKKNKIQKNWDSVKLDNGVKFFVTSRDGEGGFPGELNIEVAYLLSEDKNEFTIEYRANTTKITPIDLTNHAYFNLAGHDSK